VDQRLGRPVHPGEADLRRSPVAWRALAVRKSDELRHRIAREEAARQAIEHSLACPQDDLLDCPYFRATVKGPLRGLISLRAHSRAHGADYGQEKVDTDGT
jgi:hypothetical protein